MKSAIIAALIAAIAIGGALGAFAATRTIKTTANVEVSVWRRISDGAIFLSTRPKEGEWDAQDEPIEISGISQTGRFQVSEPVPIAVPVEVEVEVSEGESASPTPVPLPEALPDLAPVAGPCCEVQGMDGESAIRDRVVADMRRVIEFAEETYGLTHSGAITINIAFSGNGLLSRYEEAFGRPLEELPDECSFQEGEHMFFGPRCRSDKLALAGEWFVRAVGAGDARPRWVGHGAFDYFASHYAEGEVPVITEDRFRRVLFYERGRDIRLDRASDDMMTLVMLYTIEDHGEFGDWLRFYSSTLAGLDVATAFEGVFEVPLAEFYETFEEWADLQKLILVASAFRSCHEASEHLRLQFGSVGTGRGYADYRVPLEPDHDDDGIVCEGFVPPSQITVPTQ